MHSLSFRQKALAFPVRRLLSPLHSLACAPFLWLPSDHLYPPSPPYLSMYSLFCVSSSEGGRQTSFHTSVGVQVRSV